MRRRIEGGRERELLIVFTPRFGGFSSDSRHVPSFNGGACIGLIAKLCDETWGPLFLRSTCGVDTGRPVPVHATLIILARIE